jgi:glycosyltransferase involved in cell wall biosynthesis
MVSDSFDLGVDLACYHPGGAEPRDGVVFYARPDTARRGFELGMMALELFARRHPEVEIHMVGQPLSWRRPSFRYTDHGVLTPAELGELYRRCAAGLVLSLSNLSLLPAELLACGCIPVMNDAEFTRVSCESPYARFASAMPEALADALADVVEHEPGADVREQASRSVESHSWDEVGAQLDAAFRHGLAGARPLSSPSPAPSEPHPGRRSAATRPR